MEDVVIGVADDQFRVTVEIAGAVELQGVDGVGASLPPPLEDPFEHDGPHGSGNLCRRIFQQPDHPGILPKGEPLSVFATDRPGRQGQEKPGGASPALHQCFPGASFTPRRSQVM